MIAGRLESQRLTLEPLEPDHAGELAPVLDDVALHEFIGGRPESEDALRTRFARQAVGHSPDGRDRWLNWTIRLRSTNQAVGTMQATVTSDDVATLGWVIGTSHQKQGLAKEAATLVADWLRAQGIKGLRAHIHPDHHASMAVARSIGLLPADAMRHGEVRWETPR